MEDDYWAPRESFLPPIAELTVAADLLAAAADSLLACNETQARSYIEAANIPTLRAYTRSIASQTTREIHRLRDFPEIRSTIPIVTSGPRQPSPASARKIYRRDGFRCRYCGCRIVSPQAQSVISKLLPGAVQWGPLDTQLNAAFYTLKGVLDHVVPYAHGGTSEPDNVVASCQPCNYGKGKFLIQQVGLSDPRLRPPKVDEWDGLLRVLSLSPTKSNPKIKSVQAKPAAGRSTGVPRHPPMPKSVASIDDFASSFSLGNRRNLDDFLHLIESLGDVGAFYTIKKVLIVKVPAESATIDALGIEADATVQIPWWIGPYKREFRSFAERLAAALPGGTAYETEKMWRVRCFGRTPSISEVMHDPEAVRAAFTALKCALSGPSDWASVDRPTSVLERCQGQAP